MNALIAGATGGLGKCLVREALSRGMLVSVLVRDQAKLDAELGDIVKDLKKVIIGDASDAAVVANAVQGNDVVFGVCVETI